MWDFWSLTPESLHQTTILFSDRGLPTDLRHINGYGSHTYSFINKDNERFWVKFHFKTQQGIKTMTNAEAEVIVGKDRESSQRDLYEAIENKNFPKWDMKIQVMTQEEAKEFRFSPFDLTKVWPHAEFPLIDVGVMELNKNPNNYFNEIEQAAFSPSNVVSGIGLSPDKMLQARAFSYQDAHRYRIGTHYETLPVNRPLNKVNNYYADGPMNYSDITKASGVNYEPNSFDGPKENPIYNEPALEISGDADRYDRTLDNDHFTQPRDLFNLMDENQKNQLFSNIAASMEGVPKNIIDRQLTLYEKVDSAYATGVRKALNG